jgi:hypothetical protein
LDNEAEGLGLVHGCISEEEMDGSASRDFSGIGEEGFKGGRASGED